MTTINNNQHNRTHTTKRENKKQSQVGLAAAEKGARRARRAGRKAAAAAATLAHGRSPEIALDLPEALNPLAGRQQVRTVQGWMDMLTLHFFSRVVHATTN